MRRVNRGWVHHTVLILLITVVLMAALRFSWGDPKSMIAVLLAVLPILMVYLPLEASRAKNEQERINKIAERNQPVADRIITMIDEMMRPDEHGKNKKRYSPKPAILEIRKLLWIMADAELILAWNKFVQRTTREADEGDKQAPLEAGADFIQSVRKSIGHDDSKLRKDSLLSVYLKPDELKEMFSTDELPNTSTNRGN